MIGTIKPYRFFLAPAHVPVSVHTLGAASKAMPERTAIQASVCISVAALKSAPRAQRFLTLALAFICILCGTSCKPALRKESRTVFALGSVCSIQLFTEKPQNSVQSILQTCTLKLEELERHLSANAQSSTLIDINTAAGKSAVSIPDSIYPLFERAAFFAKKTDGAFNPVIGSVVKLWNIGFENAKKPLDRDIQEALIHTDHTDIVLNGSAVFLKTAGTKLDLGAIAKGFAADALSHIVTQAGITHAIIDIGGTIATVGTRPNGTTWNIGIRDPRIRHGQPVMAVLVDHGTISTSGKYERYFDEDGVRYHHIIDPATGYPVNTHLAAVSVFSPNATDADALSTACFVLGYDAAVKLLAEFPGTEALFIFDDNSVRITAGLEHRIKMFDAAFTLVE